MHVVKKIGVAAIAGASLLRKVICALSFYHRT